MLFRGLLALGCFAVLLFFFSPPWSAFLTWARAPEMGFMIPVRRGVSVLMQVKHPGIALPDELHGAIQWRLLFPIVGNVLHLPAPVFFGLAHAGCVLVLAFTITVLRRRGAGFAEAAATSLILGAASWFFASVAWLGYFDSWLVLALLVVGFSRNDWTMWAACAWAPWIDERFVIAAPLALLCRLLDRSRDDAKLSALFRTWKKDLVVPAALIALFLVVRLGLLASHSVSNATIGGYFSWLNAGTAPVSRFVFGIWEGLRAGWAFVAVALWLAWPRRAHAILLGVSTTTVMIVALATAQDFSRSMMFVAPVALLGAAQIFGATPRPRWLPRGMLAGAAAALLLPAHLVMSNDTVRVFYLYHELDAIDHPPVAMSPDFYELQGIRAMQDGKLPGAEQYLSLAIRLAKNPAAAAKQRGVLRASQQRWAEAREDFTTMIASEPRNPDGWFLRAQANLALREAPAARADMQQAMAVAPKDWTTRADVQRFLGRLNQSN